MAYTESQKQASLKYAKSKLKRVPLDLNIEEYEEYKKYVETKNKSLNGFIKEAMLEKKERDK